MSLELLSEEVLKVTLFIGELGLDGEIKPVKGILPMMIMAKEQGIKRCILPSENAVEGAVVEGIQIIGVSNFMETLAYLMEDPERADERIAPTILDVQSLFTSQEDKNVPDFADIRGQELVKRAAVIC